MLHAVNVVNSVSYYFGSSAKLEPLIVIGCWKNSQQTQIKKKEKILKADKVKEERGSSYLDQGRSSQFGSLGLRMWPPSSRSKSPD